MHRLIAILLLFALCLSPAYCDELTDASVQVRTPNGLGSGLVFRNGKHAFVWTNAHVVAHHRQQKTKIDPETGKPRVYVSFSDTELLQEVYHNGRHVGNNTRYAKVIRYSYHEDLAVLRLYDPDWVRDGIRFASPSYVPSDTTEIWHVGSPTSHVNSKLAGRVVKAGRLRDHDQIFDHINVAGFYGSSGGGVFLKDGHGCIGFLSQTGGWAHDLPNPTHAYIIPTRRIAEWAKKTRVEFAMNQEVAVPSDDVIFGRPIDDDPGPVPLDFYGPILPRLFPWPGLIPGVPG